MKFLALLAVVASIASAEPPPSNSYLPPSAAGRGSGYPQGGPAGPAFSDVAPQVVAARSFPGQGLGHGQGGHGGHGGHGSHGSHSLGGGFARSGGHGHGAQARFGSLGGHQSGLGGHNGYDHNAAAFGRNALDELSGEPANYNFGYMVSDDHEGTDFGHHEERQEERAHGEYHVVLPDGRKQTVSYEADEHGFKPRVSYQDTEALSRSNGYDSNANNIRSGNHGNGFNHGGHGDHGNGFNHGSHGANGNARSGGY